jgi:DNA replication ATP-dependent helicase Dna2
LLSNQEFKTVSEVETYYAKAQVVICTSLGINHPIFIRKRFDYCIVDEASQLNLPSCIGALRLAQSYVLVGDHYQLPPLVRSKAALKAGFGESLFKQLAEAHPQAMVQLRSQYRMNEEIMLVANRIIYNNLLRCGSETVGKQKLDTKNIIHSCFSCEYDLQCWLRVALDSK